MKIVEWVDPYTNEALEQTEKKLFNKNSEYPIIDGIPKFVKENTNEPQYDIEKCFSYQWTKSEFGQPEKFSNDDIKMPVKIEMKTNVGTMVMKLKEIKHIY
jgi:uncharacterized protein YbaR (Trm112 family)